MLGLLDRATQLTDLKSETWCSGAADLREAALNKIVLPATLLFAHGQTTKRAIVAAERYRADRQRARAT